MRRREGKRAPQRPAGWGETARPSRAALAGCRRRKAVGREISAPWPGDRAAGRTAAGRPARNRRDSGPRRAAAGRACRRNAAATRTAAAFCQAPASSSDHAANGRRHRQEPRVAAPPRLRPGRARGISRRAATVRARRRRRAPAVRARGRRLTAGWPCAAVAGNVGLRCRHRRLPCRDGCGRAATAWSYAAASPARLRPAAAGFPPATVPDGPVREGAIASACPSAAKSDRHGAGENRPRWRQVPPRVRRAGAVGEAAGANWAAGR
jgi:hypothetical protein